MSPKPKPLNRPAVPLPQRYPPSLHEATAFDVVLIAATLAAISLPFFSVEFVPGADLPQHLAQVRLFLEVMAGAHRGTLTIHWLPNTLVYLPMLVAWKLFPPIMAARMAMLAVALAWVAATFALAKARARPLEAAAIAAPLVFSVNFYSGFLNFLVGWPCFVAWFLLITKEGRDTRSGKDLLLLSGSALLLFLAHAQWFVAGVGVLLAFDLKERVPIRIVMRHLAAIAPVIVFSAFWFPRYLEYLASAGFDTSPHYYFDLPWKRLAPSWLLDAAFGGIRGPAAVIGAAGIAAWIVASAATQAGSLAKTLDRRLAMTGALFAVVVLTVPYMWNTICFDSRWAPVAATLLILALPGPRLPRWLVFSVPLSAVVCFGLVTGRAWMAFERQELSGLREALRALPDGPRVLGLDFVKQSDVLKGRPFTHIFAYAQVLHGGELNFSFAEFQNDIVGYSAPRRTTWTPGLDWDATKVTFHDFQEFDFAIVNADEEIHRRLRDQRVATPLTSTGRWRLYRCAHYATAPNTSR